MFDPPTRMLRALRIGLFLNGRKLEERILRRSEDVSFGSDAGCVFIIPPIADLPPRYVLFQIRDSGYTLCLTEFMRGKLTRRGKSESIADVYRDSLLDRDGRCRVALDEDNFGEVRLGDLRVLFQFIKPPPLLPRPVLPLSLRPSLRELIGRDRRVWLFALASFVCHFVFVIYLRAMERPKPPDIEDIPGRLRDDFVHMLVPKKLELKESRQLPKPDVQKPSLSKKEEPAEKAAESKTPKAPDPNPAAAAQAAAERQARMAEKVQNLGVLRMLTAKGPGGALSDLLKESGHEGDAEQVFRQVGGALLATADSGLGTSRGGESGQTQGIGGLVATGPKSGIGTGDKAEKKVQAIVKEEAAQDLDASDLNPAEVAAKIRQYRGALVACYETALKRNPNLSGKIVLRFTIGQIGKVTKVEIEADTMHDDEVNQCILARAMNWRFPAPQSRSDGVQFAYPFIFQASK